MAVRQFPCVEAFVKFEIPGWRLIDRPADLVLGLKFGDLHTARTLATAYGHLADGFGGEVDLPEMGILLGGELAKCPVRTLDINGRGFVITMSLSMEDRGCLYVCEGLPDQPWKVATKMLVLPFDNPPEWGENDASYQQMSGRIAPYAGLVMVNNWF